MRKKLLFVGVAAFAVALPMLMGPTGGIPSILNIQKITLKRAHSGDFNSPLSLESSSPSIQLRETDAAADEKYYQQVVGSGDYAFQAVSDAGAIHNVLSVTRSGVNVSQIDFGNDTSSPAPAYVFNGIGRITFEGAPLVGNTGPTYYWQESDAASNEKVWRAVVSGGDFFLGTQDDSFAGGENFFAIGRNGTDVTSFTINGTNMFPTSGSFTITPGGCTTAPNWTVNYIKVGRQVTLMASGAGATDQTCTSNDTIFTFGTFPAELRVTTVPTSVSTHVYDNGVAEPVVFELTSTGNGSFLSTNGGSFTASGVKGIRRGWTVVYYVD